jgi:hypothetical protein
MQLYSSGLNHQVFWVHFWACSNMIICVQMQQQLRVSLNEHWFGEHSDMEYTVGLSIVDLLVALSIIGRFINLEWNSGNIYWSWLDVFWLYWSTCDADMKCLDEHPLSFNVIHHNREFVHNESFRDPIRFQQPWLGFQMMQDDTKCNLRQPHRDTKAPTTTQCMCADWHCLSEIDDILTLFNGTWNYTWTIMKNLTRHCDGIHCATLTFQRSAPQLQGSDYGAAHGC